MWESCTPIVHVHSLMGGSGFCESRLAVQETRKRTGGTHQKGTLCHDRGQDAVQKKRESAVRLIDPRSALRSPADSKCHGLFSGAKISHLGRSQATFSPLLVTGCLQD